MRVNIEQHDDPRYAALAQAVLDNLKQRQLPEEATILISRHDLHEEDDDLEDDAPVWVFPMIVRVEGFSSNPHEDAVGLCCAYAGSTSEQAGWLLQQLNTDLPQRA